MREADTVARMGGDEFMVLLPEVDGGRDCTTVADNLLHSFAKPFPVESRQLVVSGASESPLHRWAAAMPRP